MSWLTLALESKQSSNTSSHAKHPAGGFADELRTQVLEPHAVFDGGKLVVMAALVDKQRSS